MPLVTITCSDTYYPSDTTLEQRAPSSASMSIIELARKLPAMLVQRCAVLGLDEGTPEKAVQVDIKKFHRFAVNAVDIWVHIWLTEHDFDQKSRDRVREELKTLIMQWAIGNDLPCSIALDVFFGPGVGFYVDISEDIDSKPQEW